MKRVIVIPVLMAAVAACSSSPKIPAGPRAAACAKLQSLAVQTRAGKVSRAEGQKMFLAVIADAKRSGDAALKDSATKLERFIAFESAGVEYLPSASTPEELSTPISEQAGKEIVKMADTCGFAFPSGSAAPSSS